MDRDQRDRRGRGTQMQALAALPVSRSNGLDRHLFESALTLETCLWLVLVVGAAVSRFWDLGYRALHHDESLHAYYSWVFAEG
ncbi:MAG: hypothetical protein QM589_09660, partial [Thermomicrobiales bacterium]